MSACRSCGAEIIWAVTENGKRIPLDFEPALAVPTGMFHIDEIGPAGPLAVVTWNTRVGRIALRDVPERRPAPQVQTLTLVSVR